MSRPDWLSNKTKGPPRTDLILYLCQCLSLPSNSYSTSARLPPREPLSLSLCTATQLGRPLAAEPCYGALCASLIEQAGLPVTRLCPSNCQGLLVWSSPFLRILLTREDIMIHQRHLLQLVSL